MAGPIGHTAAARAHEKDGQTRKRPDPCVHGSGLVTSAAGRRYQRPATTLAIRPVATAINT